MSFAIISVLNLVLLAGGLALFVLLAMVLIKLNRALNIWLSRNS